MRRDISNDVIARTSACYSEELQCCSTVPAPSMLCNDPQYMPFIASPKEEDQVYNSRASIVHGRTPSNNIRPNKGQELTYIQTSRSVHFRDSDDLTRTGLLSMRRPPEPYITIGYGQEHEEFICTKAQCIHMYNDKTDNISRSPPCTI